MVIQGYDIEKSETSLKSATPKDPIERSIPEHMRKIRFLIL